MEQLQIYKTELTAITMIRGVACVAVCLAHFSGTTSNEIIQIIFHYGILGVDLFFVLSGFILPYSLFKSGYQLKKYYLFLWKRLIRIEPPFLISIVIIITLSYLAQLSPNHSSTPM